MAKVAADLHRRIDLLLDYLFEAWKELPSAARQIDGWDVADQVDYVEEWVPKLQRLEELRRYVRAGRLTEEQISRYQQLEELVQQHAHLLEQVRSGSQTGR